MDEEKESLDRKYKEEMWSHLKYLEKAEEEIKRRKKKLAAAMEGTLSELDCKICQEPLISPHVTPCSHVFCFMCLMRWNKSYWMRVIDGLVPCPQCREPIIGPAAIIEAAIDKLYENASRKEKEERQAKVTERKGEGQGSLFELY